ncbi:Prickle-like protein 4 [Fukomys damarensis]|uniref:Prickle-like protein 4 n=1 Tax=Fukomys damarensis TaxID=885580 RepID=A0A091EKS4_FUKDA|nr:Prickle-like protein 4 [Fukomys damarensis]
MAEVEQKQQRTFGKFTYGSVDLDQPLDKPYGKLLQLYRSKVGVYNGKTFSQPGLGKAGPSHRGGSVRKPTDRTLGWEDTAESPSPPLDPQLDGARRTRDHAASPPPGTEMIEEVAAPGPEGEQPILATFHRKPELGDRAGRNQTSPPPVTVLNPGWPDPEDSPISREPGPQVHSDSDSGQLPEEYSGYLCSALSMDPPRRDTSLPAKWPGVWTLLQQLPPQDCDERYCLALGEEELAELRLFCAQRKQKALGQGVARLIPPELEGHTCEKCKQQLRPGEVGIFAAPEGEQHCWHWPCFVCQACGQVLMHLIYFYHDGHLYCGRHHAELLRPRCPACDQLIFSRRCTEAEGRRWHENHFCCLDCAGPLAEGRYTLPGGSPCCPSCFESRYPDTAGAAEGQAPRGSPSRINTGFAVRHDLQFPFHSPFMFMAFLKANQPYQLSGVDSHQASGSTAAEML